MRNRVPVGIADGDFHREALRDVDPVNAFLDQRQPFDDAPTFGQNPGADSNPPPLLKVRLWLVITVIRAATPGARCSGRFRGSSRITYQRSSSSRVKTGFAAPRGVLANGGFQRHHHAVERRAHFRVKSQMQFSEGDLRQDPGALRHHGIHAGHGRRGPVWPAAAWPPAPPRAAFSAVRA